MNALFKKWVDDIRLKQSPLHIPSMPLEEIAWLFVQAFIDEVTKEYDGDYQAAVRSAQRKLME